MPYTIEQAQQVTADLEHEIADLRQRDEQGRFAPATDLLTAFNRGGYATVEEAAAQLTPDSPDFNAALRVLHASARAHDLERLGLRSAAPSHAGPKGPPDFGGGATRGRTPEPAPPGMNDALRTLIRRRGY